jgi:hypothetical protein
MSALIEDIEIVCPYCGEIMEADIDCTAGNQLYYEECQVCCSPVKFIVTVDDVGNLTEVKARREDE